MSRCTMCMRHEWRELKSGVEKCVRCGTRFPCRGACTHVDCEDRRRELAEFKIDHERLKAGAL